MAHFEIHVLNYNGLRFLQTCLSALLKLKVGHHKVSINLVDNGSSDDSERFVKEQFPEVNFVALGKNLGFTEGNNQAVLISAARNLKLYGRRQDYDIFLNNDTEVTEDWLLKAAEVLENQPDVGIVGSKSLFMDHFIGLNLKISPAYEPSKFGSQDSRILGAYLNTPIQGENIKSEAVRYRWKNCFNQEATGRWISPDSSIFIPVNDVSKASKISLNLNFDQNHAAPIKVQLFKNNDLQAFKTYSPKPGETLHISLSFLVSDYVRVIQNMGSFVTKNWDAGDLYFGEIDSNQQQVPEQVSAICGVSMFIRHALFRQLSGFDSRYFAYFEDTDLSIRAYLAGYKCVVVPDSVLYHLHCGSSGGEWSPAFSRLVAFSHLLFSSKFAPNAVWEKRLAELKKAAKQQFEVYMQNNDLDTTPQLRAYLSYLKKPHVFLLNRFRKRKYDKKLENFPFTDRK